MRRIVPYRGLLSCDVGSRAALRPILGRGAACLRVLCASRGCVTAFRLRLSAVVASGPSSLGHTLPTAQNCFDQTSRRTRPESLSHALRPRPAIVGQPRFSARILALASMRRRRTSDARTNE